LLIVPVRVAIERTVFEAGNVQAEKPILQAEKPILQATPQNATAGDLLRRSAQASTRLPKSSVAW
jgi:hypothetical protein